jgi:dihydrofolate synthase/folylpolyglutamate synthase
VVPAEYHEKIISLAEVSQALKKAEELSAKEDLICVAGSLYLIGAVREILLPGKSEETWIDGL